MQQILCALALAGATFCAATTAASAHDSKGLVHDTRHIAEAYWRTTMCGPVFMTMPIVAVPRMRKRFKFLGSFHARNGRCGILFDASLLRQPLRFCRLVAGHEGGHAHGWRFPGGPDDGHHHPDPRHFMYPEEHGQPFAPCDRMRHRLG